MRYLTNDSILVKSINRSFQYKKENFSNIETIKKPFFEIYYEIFMRYEF